MNAIYTLNAELNGVEISFGEKPGEEIRAALKQAGFRWHKAKKVWYAKQTADRIALAERLVLGGSANEGNPDAVPVSELPAAPEKLEIPEPVQIENGLYSGWKGGKNAEWHTDKELKALLSADFKKVGIPCTIRFNRAGYLTSLTVTIKISAADVRSYEDWASADFYVKPNNWVHYRDENGELRDIFGERFYSLPEAEQAAMLENIKKTSYEIEVEHLTTNPVAHGYKIDVLTEDANRRFSTVCAIVNSYNRDCSNSMVDYFDRDIYDRYIFKIA